LTPERRARDAHGMSKDTAEAERGRQDSSPELPPATGLPISEDDVMAAMMAVFANGQAHRRTSSTRRRRPAASSPWRTSTCSARTSWPSGTLPSRSTASRDESAAGGSGDGYHLPLWTGHMGQVSVCARAASGASWGRLGIVWPSGRGSNVGRRAADRGEVSRHPLGTCAEDAISLRGIKLVRDWSIFPSGQIKVP
jgi:hypothetical protein